MKRNKNIDYLRSLSILLIVVYHIYIVSGLTFPNAYLNTFISFGGELGVSFFFFISGYSIFKSLSKKKINYLEYLKQRVKRIAPHYYISLTISLLFTSAIVYLNKEHLLNLVSHLFFFHNLFFTCHGTINGVLWTMGIIFQFYLIAPLLYKLLNKRPILTLFFSVVFSLGCKWLIFYILLPKNGLGSSYYFIYDRQLFTTLTSFALGMLISKYEYKNHFKNRNNILLSLFFFSTIVFFILIGANAFPFLNSYIHAKTLKGLFYFYVLDFLIAFFVFFFASIKIKSNPICTILTFLSKHEYAIYIWHLLLLNQLMNTNTFIKNLMNVPPWLFYLILVILLIGISCIFDLIINKVDFESINEEIKNLYSKIKKHLLSITIFSVFIFTLTYIPKIYEIYQNKSESLSKCIEACPIYENIKQKMICENGPCTYIYIDTADTGYLYFYQLRYYLSPNRIDHYNNYVYTINHGSDSQFIDFIKSTKADYVIVRNSQRLLTHNYELDLEKGKIFTINYEATTISDLLKEVTK